MGQPVRILGLGQMGMEEWGPWWSLSVDGNSSGKRERNMKDEQKARQWALVAQLEWEGRPSRRPRQETVTNSLN